jgi:hypothetical protein
VRLFDPTHLPRKRKSSRPLLSGDTFMDFADVAILQGDNESYCRKALQFVENIAGARKTVLFIEVSFLSNPHSESLFLDWLDSANPEVLKNITVVMHNGDLIPPPIFFKQIEEKFFAVYCVNIIDPESKISPLPIGLENYHHKKNGVGSEFTIPEDYKFQVNPVTSTANRILFSFKVENNRTERQPLREMVTSFGHSFKEPNMSPSDYRKLVKECQFIVSPPGNGFDCHRTWEALYLGAIPVVLKKFTHPMWSQLLPILEVERWEDFFQFSENELDSFVNKASQKDCRTLSANYWENLISSTSSPR